MELALSPEQEMLRDTANGYLAKQAPSWATICDMGWLDPDLELLDEVVLFEATGAALLPEPLFSTRLILPLLNGTRLLDDTKRVALAWTEEGRPTTFTGTFATTLAGDRVSGRKVLVAEGDQVDAFIVVTDNGLAVVDASEAQITPRQTIDLSRKFSDVEFGSVKATPLETPAGALEALQSRAFVLAAAEALGVGNQALQLGIEHAKVRRQFGKLIGTYQAVSHALVDAHIDLELGRSLTYWAAQTGAEQNAAAAAKAHTTAAAVRACEVAIQVSGGNGMTWENPLHRLYKRAQWLNSYIAGEDRLYDTIAGSLLP
ncbi:acyl-CoA dehydrogenase family protein [Nocardia fluminea]|uniref:Acyl-CoA dehydrogenase-like protein n=1 Tax=Nocardia fluminea TaxID=134984 RepID=A0A2N3VK34_9NOCA|nr:acyl-CoA dehydrogenase family protein [Nocardia fluminea]PKV81982.1 acyl-CoA dehydrogenase-like protein [Nocardia fluminea]